MKYKTMSTASTDKEVKDLFSQLIKDVDNRVPTKPAMELSHVGVLGMKWGVRRQTGAGGVVRSLSKSSKQRSEDFVKSRDIMKKSPKKLSNDDIQQLNKRLQLEKSLRELKTSDKTKGLSFVKTLTSVGTTLSAAYAVSQTPLGKAVKNAVKNAAEGR